MSAAASSTTTMIPTTTVAASTAKTNSSGNEGGYYGYFNFLSFACGIVAVLVARAIYRKLRIRYRRNVSVIDMDQVDDGIICSSRRTIASSVNTIVSGNGENRSEGDDGGENAFYGRAYDGLGEVF